MRTDNKAIESIEIIPEVITVPALIVIKGNKISRTARREHLSNMICEWYDKGYNMCTIQGLHDEYVNGYSLYQALDNLLNGQTTKDGTVLYEGLNKLMNPKLMIWWAWKELSSVDRYGKPVRPKKIEQSHITLYKEGATQPASFYVKPPVARETDRNTYQAVRVVEHSSAKELAELTAHYKAPVVEQYENPARRKVRLDRENWQRKNK
jgi:hypothetical protein